jgi:hypothetical protein
MIVGTRARFLIENAEIKGCQAPASAIPLNEHLHNIGQPHMEQHDKKKRQHGCGWVTLHCRNNLDQAATEH